MAKKKRIRYKNMSETERMRLETKSMDVEKGIYGEEKDGKREFRKRRKAGTLNEIKDKVRTPYVNPPKMTPKVVRKTIEVSNKGVSKLLSESVDEPQIVGSPEAQAQASQAKAGRIARLAKTDMISNGTNLTSPQELAKNEIISDTTLSVEDAGEKLDAGDNLNKEIHDGNKKNDALYKVVTDPNASNESEVILDKEALDNASTDMENAEDEEAFNLASDNFKKLMEAKGRTEGEPAIERLGLTDYYPNIQKSAAAGSYSRATLGSGNIYAASGLVIPHGIIDARKRAIASHAAQKAKDNDRIKASMFIDGAIQYQGQFTDKSIEMLEDFGAASNYNYSELAKGDTTLGRKFVKKMQRWQTFGKQTIDMNKRVQKLLGSSKGNTAGSQNVTLPDDVRLAANAWLDGKSKGMEYYFDNPKAFAKIYQKLKSYEDLTFAGNEIVGNIERTEKPLLMTNVDYSDPKVAANFAEGMHRIKHGNADEIHSFKYKFIDPNLLNDITSAYMDNHNFYTPEGKAKAQQNLNAYVLGMLAPQIEKEFQAFTHGDSRNARQWDKHNRKKKEEDKLHLWEQSMNEAANPVRKQGLAAAMVGDTDAEKEANVIAWWAESGLGFKPKLDANGKFVDGEIAGTIQHTNQKANITLGNMTFEARSGRPVTYSQYMVELGRKPEKDLTETDKYMLKSKPNDVIKDAAVSEQTISYQHKDEAGKNWNVRYYDNPSKLAGAKAVGTKTFGGSRKVKGEFKDYEGQSLVKFVFQPSPDGRATSKPYEVYVPKDANGNAQAPTPKEGYSNGIGVDVEDADMYINYPTMSYSFSEDNTTDISVADSDNLNVNKVITESGARDSDDDNDDDADNF